MKKKDLLKFVDELKENLETIPSLNEVNRHVEEFLLQLDKELPTAKIKI